MIGRVWGGESQESRFRKLFLVDPEDPIHRSNTRVDPKAGLWRVGTRRERGLGFNGSGLVV